MIYTAFDLPCWTGADEALLKQTFWTQGDESILQAYVSKHTNLRPLWKLMLMRYGCYLYDLFTYGLKNDPRYCEIKVKSIPYLLPYPSHDMCAALRKLLCHPI